MLDINTNQGIQIKSDVENGSLFSFTITNVDSILGGRHHLHSHSRSFLSGVGHNKDFLTPASERKDMEYNFIIHSPVKSPKYVYQIDHQIATKTPKKWRMFKLNDHFIGDDAASLVPESQTEHKIALIVDDDCFNILALKFLLSQLGITSEFANNGKEAVEKVLTKSNVYDVIFMDCQMPIMNGYEATTLLTTMMQEGRIREVPIIGCTAFSAKDKLEECIRCGMKEVINKPVVKNKLEEVVQKYIN